MISLKKYKLMCLLLSLILIVNIVNLFFSINERNEAESSYNIEALNEIKIGLSKDFVDSLIGTPKTQEKTTLYHYKDKDEIFTKADYKYGNTAVLCLYENNSLIAFGIVVNENNEYKVTSKYFLKKDKFLKDFTYNDFCEYVHDYSCNVPASNLFATYYYEIYDESNATGNISSFLASYVYFEDNNILHVGQESRIKNDDKNKMSEELKQERNKAKPNVYGEIHPDYVKNFNFPGDLLTFNAGRIIF